MIIFIKFASKWQKSFTREDERGNIPWLLFSISAIISLSISKNAAEIRDECDNPNNDFLLRFEKYGELGIDEKLLMLQC